MCALEHDLMAAASMEILSMVSILWTLDHWSTGLVMVVEQHMYQVRWTGHSFIHASITVMMSAAGQWSLH